MSDARPPRLAGVQVLRFAAALLVVITHATLYTRDRLDDSVGVWHFGEVGVDVFFVISGLVMVVSAAGLRDPAVAWKKFAVRRLVRIAPIYWLATTLKLATLLVLPGAALYGQFSPLNTVLSYLFLPSTNTAGKVEPLLGVGWTLTFEMFFYGVFALALALRTDPVRFCAVVLAALAVASLFRTEGWPAATVYANPRVLYFLAGMVIGRFLLDRSRRGLVMGLAAALGLFTVIRAVGALETGSFELWADLGRHTTAVLLVLVVALAEPWLGARAPRPLLFLGNASYSLYLFHPLAAPVVPAALAAVGLGAPWLSVSLCLVTAVVVSAVVHLWVEQPVTAYLQGRVPHAGRPRTRTATAETSEVTTAP